MLQDFVNRIVAGFSKKHQKNYKCSRSAERLTIFVLDNSGDVEDTSIMDEKCRDSALRMIPNTQRSDKLKRVSTQEYNSLLKDARMGRVLTPENFKKLYRGRKYGGFRRLLAECIHNTIRSRYNKRLSDKFIVMGGCDTVRDANGKTSPAISMCGTLPNWLSVNVNDFMRKMARTLIHAEGERIVAVAAREFDAMVQNIDNAIVNLVSDDEDGIACHFLSIVSHCQNISKLFWFREGYDMRILSKHRNDTIFCNAKHSNILIVLRKFCAELDKQYRGGAASVAGLFCMCANDLMPPLRNITKKVPLENTKT